jgi:dTDP-4-amino-4,6-dideoxygalactose transaminase
MKKNVNCLYGGALVVNDVEIRRSCRGSLEGLPLERGRKLAKRALLSWCRDMSSSQPFFRMVTFPALRRRVRNGGETATAAVAYEHNPVRRDELPHDYLRRMTRRQAAIVSRQLPDVDRQVDVRIGYARLYHAMLGDVSGIQLPPLREDGSHIYLMFPVQVPDRLEFQRELMAHDCDVRLQTFVNLASAPCYREFRRECPTAARVARQAVLLPMYTELGTAEVRRVGAVIRALLR